MRRFTALYRQLDETTKTSRKVAAMRNYFAGAAPADGAWAVYFLCGRKLKRLVLSRNLQRWCSEAAGIADWLFAECRETVGDLAETMALLLAAPAESSEAGLSQWVGEVLKPLALLTEDQQRELLLTSWSRLSPEERLVFNKLITASFRVGVSGGLVIRALSEVSGLSRQTIAHRLMGDWEPSADFYCALMNPQGAAAEPSRPYPFCLAHPLQSELESLGNPEDWLIEWKWDGIRAQLIRRQGEFYLWSRGEDLITERFPDLRPAAALFDDGTVLDGEIVGWKLGQVLPFSALQQRIGRKKLGEKILGEVPARFAKAYSGLTDEEIHDVDRFVRRNTVERFGPVHAVKPELVFELAFDGIQYSSRHKSGIAVRFPRMARWRHDKRPEEADSLDSVKALMVREAVR